MFKPLHTVTPVPRGITHTTLSFLQVGCASFLDKLVWVGRVRARSRSELVRRPKDTMGAVKVLALFIPLALIASLPAMADTCNPFASLNCAKSTPDNVHFVGTGTTGQDVNILLGSNTFTVSLVGKAASHFAGDDLIILAAAPNGLTGKVNGVSFTPLSSFAEGGAIGAIKDTWSDLGISAGNIKFGYANVGLFTGNPFSIMASGVKAGTIFYAELVNPTTGKIV